jgi:uncharacterized protein
MITQGYLSRHFQGRAGMADPALLDVAQDYALTYLHDQGMFDLGVVLKGGTSLRKFRAGNAGRFSTDLDFAVPDLETAGILLDTLDGAELHDVRFGIEERDALRGRLVVNTPLGQPRIPARVEISLRALWLPAAIRKPIALPVHKGYEFHLPAVPVPALEEALAEKLAAWRRRRKIRDLYDLAFFGRGVLDEGLIRRLFVLKVWYDVVVDGLGDGPLHPSEIVAGIDLDRLPPEDIGLLAQPVEHVAWLRQIRIRFAFLAQLDEIELRVAKCNARDRYTVAQLVAALPQPSDAGS